jgi:hypothetical protein
MVHNLVDILLDGLVALLSIVLMLVMGFTLPIVNAIGSEDIKDLVGDLSHSSITNELVWGSPFSDTLLENASKFTISLHTITIGKK